MRIFKNFKQLIQELPREVFTRGQEVFDKSVQGKIVTQGEGFEQKELFGMSYMINDFSDRDEMMFLAQKMFNKEHLTKEVAEQWFWDMIHNPTTKETWFDKTQYTKEYFEKFCNENNSGTSAYGYGERIIPQLDSLIKRLKGNLYARGAYIAMHDNRDIHRIGRRIPCTLSYGFAVRKTLAGDKMNMFLHMRSQDLVNFMTLDLYKATLFLESVAKEPNVKKGKLIVYVDSLHAYKRDVPSSVTW